MAEKLIKHTEWQGFYKDNEGEAHIVDLVSNTTVPDLDIEDALIRQVPPVKIKPSRAKRKQRKDILIQDLPDIQYGWRKLPDDSLVPLHDPKALDVALKVSKEFQPLVIKDGVTQVNDLEFIGEAKW